MATRASQPRATPVFGLNARERLSDPQQKRELNEQLFGVVAPRYDAITRVLSFNRDRVWKQRMVEALPPKTAPVCLDLACGTGDITFRLASKYPDGSIIGLDLTEPMLERARARCTAPHIHFQRGDMGQTGLGSGLPGGHRIKLRFSDPMLLDDVAADFPDLTVVMAHPAVPWVDSQIAIASHKANVFVDLSGWSPKYFPPQLVSAIGRQLRTKALFGTDHPYISLERWRRDFDALGVDADVVQLILKQIAVRVLGLAR